MNQEYVFYWAIFLVKQNDVNNRLEELLGRQCRIERQMNGIGRSLASLTTASDESNSLNSMIVNTSVLAENVSAKVRRLDEARVSIGIQHCSSNLKKILNSNLIFSLETCIRMSAASA